MKNFLIGLNAINIGALLLAIVYTAGVVWRVEKKLDVSYKLYLSAIIFLFVAETADLYYALDNTFAFALIVKIGRVLFAMLFLAGILEMRSVIRKMDGEIGSSK